jgi:hypothetical protein
MRRLFTLGWFLWSAAGLLVLIGWDICHAVAVRPDRWMLVLVPIYALLSWCFFKAFQITRRKTKSDSN